MLEILISSSVLILALALLRLVLRGRISARLQYALWLLVALRLLVPVSLFHSPVSVAEAAAPAIHRVESYSARTPVYMVSNAAAPAAESAGQPESGAARHSWTVKDAARYVWYAGMAVTAVWFLLVNIRLARRLKETRAPYEYSAMLPVYTAPGLPSPCLFGLLKPAVYLTAHAAGDRAQTTRIVTHELTHYRHGDMIWALLRSICLVVWWFNPLVWLAAALSREDCELACDEGTIKALGENARFDYGRTLVDMAAAGKGKAADLLCGATTMTGGDKSLRQRVTRIVRAPKMSVSAAAIVLAIAAIAAGCAFTGAAKTESAPEAMPEQMKLNVFYPIPGEGDDISITVSDSQAIQEMYDLYLSLRDKAVPMDEDYDVQHGSPIYSVYFLNGDPADYQADGKQLGFQLWEGGQFCFYNGDVNIYETITWPQQVYYSKEYGALFEELMNKYLSESVEAEAVGDEVMKYDREYWEEVERELGSFAEPADIEVVVSDFFDDTLPEDDIFGPMTIADYIYGTDSWRFQYNSDRIAYDPDATIKVYDADGRVLWIVDDTEALMIEEADGSVTWVWTGESGDFPPTKYSNLDCADMIRHLRSWALGEHPTTAALAESVE